jgi:hypothetical protein
MSTREELIEWVERAQRLLAGTKDPYPDFWYDSVEKQLQYVMEVAKSPHGRAPSSESKELSMGLLAVREIEPAYPDLANAIYEVMGRFRKLHGSP